MHTWCMKEAINDAKHGELRALSPKRFLVKVEHEDHPIALKSPESFCLGSALNA